jgi:hypothetical protein
MCYLNRTHHVLTTDPPFGLTGAGLGRSFGARSTPDRFWIAFQRIVAGNSCENQAAS